MLRTRLILGTLSIGAIISLAWLDTALASSLGSGFVLFVLLGLLSAVGALELSRMLQNIDIPSSPWVLILAALIGLTSTIAPRLDPTLAQAWIVFPTSASFVLLLQAFDLIRRQHTEHSASALASSQLAMVYLGVLPAFYFLMCYEHDAYTVLIIVLITKSCDIGAYFIGTAVGRHKLIPWLSPAKSWEGLFGGMLTSGLVGALATMVLGGTLAVPVWYGGLIGLILGAVGQGGDLLESLLKRSTGVKDSGVVPGFGGVLDMIDSPIIVAPVAYWLLYVAPSL
ncbi:MAG: phosphatidate cytidylyltransferase [Phycisphaerales bacterium JB043]